MADMDAVADERCEGDRPRSIYAPHSVHHKDHMVYTKIVQELSCLKRTMEDFSERLSGQESDISSLKLELQGKIDGSVNKPLRNGEVAEKLPSRNSNAATVKETLQECNLSEVPDEFSATVKEMLQESNLGEVPQTLNKQNKMKSPTVEDIDVLCDEGLIRHTTSAPHPLSHRFELQREVSVNDSSWEIAAFIGFHKVGHMASVILTFVLLLNIIMQGIFCKAASDSMTEDEFGEERQEQYLQWRITAHDENNLDRITGRTMVERVCDEDMSLSTATQQLQIYEVIDRYLTPSFGLIPAGLLMCLLALLIWYLRLMEELNAMHDYISLIWHVEIGPLEFGLTEKGTYEIKSMDLLRKIACSVVTLARLAVCISLTMVGTNFIIRTHSIEELLLNALALELVLNVDEYLFMTLVPRRVQNFQMMIEPINLGAFKHFKGVTTRSALVFTSTPIIMTVVYYKLLQPHVDNIRAVEQALCSGKKDFVFITSPNGLPHATTDFDYRVSGMMADGINTLNFDAVKSAALDGVDADSADNMLIWERGVHALTAIEGQQLEKGVANLNHLQSTCEDLLADPECSEEVVIVDGRCPDGYMMPRDAQECRNAAVALGMWNKSAQLQQARADYEADYEPNLKFFWTGIKPCVLGRLDGSETKRFMWTENNGVDWTGPCICRQKMAKLLKDYAELYNKVPVSSCDALEQMGACVVVNPPGSSLTENASFARQLCPQACGCTLWPPAPLRNWYCVDHCRFRETGFNRPCQDISVQDWSNMKQLQFLSEDSSSIPQTREALSYLIGDFKIRGCNVLTVLQDPYSEHSSDVAGPVCKLSSMRLGSLQQYASCLMVRCQDHDEDECQLAAAEKACDDDSELHPRMQKNRLCPRSCRSCLEAPRCSWHDRYASSAASSYEIWLVEEFRWTEFFRGFCPVTCECLKDSLGNQLDGCPASCPTA